MSKAKHTDTHHHEATVPCENCHKEIPESAAQTAEGHDYVKYFCGEKCFKEWEKRKKKK